MEKDFESLKEILKRYDPIEELKNKHALQKEKEFIEWLNK